MQSVLANSHLALSNVSFAPKTSQNSNLGQNGPKAVQNDVKVGWSTSMVPKGITRMQTFAVSRENDGIAERRMCIRARFRREKSDLSGANDKEDSEIGERLIIRENHTNSDIYTRKDITSDLAKDPRIAIDEGSKEPGFPVVENMCLQYQGPLCASIMDSWNFKSGPLLTA
eukprot:Gb_20125 [translate_table: standard]